MTQENKKITSNDGGAKGKEPKTPKKPVNMHSHATRSTSANEMSNDSSTEDNIQTEILKSITELMPKILPDIISAVIPKVMKELLPLVTKSVEAQMKELIDDQIETRTSVRHAKVCSDIDDIRQKDKNYNLRIVGLPEEENVDDFIVNTATKLHINVNRSDFVHYRIGKKKDNSSRSVIVRFNNPDVKVSILRLKKNIKKDLMDRNISFYEDLTKARRVLLGVVKERYRSAHTRNGTVCFYTKNNQDVERLVYIKNPNYLFEYGFDMEEIVKCERALME